jgi:transcriptional regulator with XRE-family HTH domain
LVTETVPTIPIGTRLKIELVLHGRTAGEVARKAGTSPATLSRVLSNTQEPSRDLLRRIEAAIREAQP